VIEELFKHPKLLELQEAFKQGDPVLIEELWNAPKALIASLALQVTGKHVLILTGGSQEESRLYHDFPFFSSAPLLEFPAWETLPSENIAPSPDTVGARYKALRQVSATFQPHIIISGLQACLQSLIPPQNFDSLYLALKKGETFPFDTLIQRLNEMGYRRSAVAADKGEFAIRGGIIDIFPVASPDPFRIEFWGDDIESIRIFDPIGQRSIKTVEHIEITPAQEMELIQQSSKLSTILDYLGPQTIVIFDDLLALEDRYSSLLHICGSPTRSFQSIENLFEQIAPLQQIYWSRQPIEELTEVKLKSPKGKSFYSESAPMHTLAFSMFNKDLMAKRWLSPFIPLVDYLLPFRDEEQEVSGNDILENLAHIPKEAHLHFLCASELEENTLKQKIAQKSIPLPTQTVYQNGYLSSGLVLAQEQLLVIPFTEVSHRYKLRRQKLRSTYHTPPSESYHLVPGDMVVHLNHGIGRFLGLEKKLNHNGVLSEFFLIEYAENGKLYVPLNQAHLVTKYIGSSEDLPSMHTLGSARWKKTKERTQEAIVGYAKDLLQLYAHRSLKAGLIYPSDSIDMQDFEEDFPYEETEDQLNAIASIKEDMQSTKSMDRLICGDVGYGKTEVAMRAAFKAVMDGHKQVALLVPTTVLAMQHYENFIERMSNFPVRIGVLSRFRTPKEIRETLEQVAKGSIDILIGTHRLISKDVVFHDLGLIIIDEEHRFGVKAKEHLKKIKMGVDCITLSATPIPRTLYMSLVGARDMSVINTPPQDRLPITTIISEPGDLVFKNALLRELSRDGQAYVIHNRVETIFGVASKIKELLPQARVVVGHGQMSADEIDSVFHAFKSGAADILVATTIIESGIDIPNANTILINRADQFGLADLYQLRGRVGRWNRRAYAYFLVPNLKSLPQLARKRLHALAEACGYGGGMKLAMHDLEIRGAGNILGTEQSGHVSAIGFHFYCKLLRRTIQTLQGELSAGMVETKLEFHYDACLPEDYVNEVSLRMEIYQRLGEAIALSDVELIEQELKDRFGPLVIQVQWLMALTRIRVFASQRGYTTLKFDKLAISIEWKKGKQILSHKMLLGKIKTPEELERVTKQALDKWEKERFKR
jgi:transcription-repair coupling factor (superfamily II helicase)